MYVLLEKMEECLYEVKHHNEFSVTAKNYITDVEMALARLISYIEKEESTDEEDNYSTNISKS